MSLRIARCALWSLRIAPLWIVGCVSLSELPPGTIPDQPSAAVPAGEAYPELDLGWTSYQSSHFTVKGYRESEIRPIGVMAESLFDLLSNETGLYSFISSAKYTLTVYRDQSEYVQKTKQPESSRVAVSGGGIYTYLGAEMEPDLAFELASLVISQHLGERLAVNRWIQQGLALRQEVAELTDGERTAYLSNQANQLRQNRASFSQMTFATSASKENRRKDLWFMQCESVVRFLISQGSALSFAGLLNSLKTGADIDQALASNYPGKFRNLTDLENAWKYTL